MAYSDFDFYQSTYLGNEIVESEYPRLSQRASEYINRLTFGRAATDTTNTTAIKNAECAIAEQIKRHENDAGADGIQSESIGSSAVTYAENSSRRQTIMEKVTSAAAQYLGSTGLMFAGFASGEYGGTVAS